MIRVAGIADKMAKNQKQIAISEFFEKNKHFLGFDSLQRSIITAVKEAVDNSLDACEEARILPNLKVKISKVDSKKDILELETEDNGPGIPQRSIEKVFGQLLFGSRFHAIRQSRGQQGIGITGVVMYSQLTTGKPTHVLSKISSDDTAVSVNIGLDTRKNKAVKSEQTRIIWENDDLSKKDIEALNAELSDPRFADGWWQNQITTMLELGKKAEQQSLAKYGLDFVTETYLPEKLAEIGLA